jgi:hypothetical protein
MNGVYGYAYCSLFRKLLAMISNKNILIILMGCVLYTPNCNVAPTVQVASAVKSLPEIHGNVGSFYPHIQSVYPGTLQSLDVPQAVPQNVTPADPAIVVIFSLEMENYDGTMNCSLQLVDEYNGSVVPSYVYSTAASMTTAAVSRSSNVGVITTSSAHNLVTGDLVSITGLKNTHAGYNTLQPVSITVLNATDFSFSNPGADESAAADTGGLVHGSSSSFRIVPCIAGLPLGSLNPDTEYAVRIFKTAHAGRSYGGAYKSRTLKFENLVQPPASGVSPADPDFVVYKFRTGAQSERDAVPPTLFSAIPADGEIDIDPALSIFGGRITIVFHDNLIPMINPDTVNITSVRLLNLTDASYIACYIVLDSGDTEWKTYWLYPSTALLNAKDYELQVSPASAPVRDFAGNMVLRRNFHFSTAP